ncbi:uncharacterized protein [Halyomorpha halys]|uniref:uncharacterized protein n=1 Tax=Halyomorpha halys TaxID=286706 RepID=UPI0006D527E9|nr:uncharacterized protein LOC106692826 [Halyomorpha halys]
MSRVLLVVVALAVSASGAAVQNSVQEDCGPCLKYRLLSMVDSVFNRAEEGISLAEGISLVKSPGGGGAPRSLSKTEAEKTDLEDLLADRVKRFVSTHTLKMDLRGVDIVDAATSAGRAIGGAVDFFSDLTGVEEEGGDGEESARKKVKKAGKMLLPLLLMIKMKVAMFAKLAFAAIALIAGKALLIGKIALLLSGIIAIKKLLSQQQKSVTYEIVPHHAEHHDHHHEQGWSSGGGGDVGGHHGWGRSADEMAYSAYQPQQPAAAQQ